MKAINKFLDNNIIKIITLFLLISPFLDLLTSLMIHYTNISLTIGIVIRFCFLMFLTFYCVFINKMNNKFSKRYVLMISIYLIICVLLFLDSNVFIEIKNLFKVFYMPIIFAFTYSICINKKEVIKDSSIVNTLYIYILLIFIANITKTALLSYEVAKMGYVGWFNAANEIGAIIAIIFPILTRYVLNNKNVKNIIMFLLTIIVIFMIGTKTPFISLVLTLSYYIIKKIINLIKLKDLKKTMALLSSIVITLTLFLNLIPKTPIYKNTMIHLNFLNVNDVSDLLTVEKLDHFILGQRLTFLEKNYNQYKKSPVENKLLGIGYENDKLVEMDALDIFFRHGLIGFILFLTPFIIVGFKNKKKLNNFYLLPIIIMIFISTFAGHVLTAPAVSFFGLIVFVKWVINKKERL
ncbi:MAG: O-antigen ligase family protein [Bacilli bacterium]